MLYKWYVWVSVFLSLRITFSGCLITCDFPVCTCVVFLHNNREHHAPLTPPTLLWKWVCFCCVWVIPKPVLWWWIITETHWSCLLPLLSSVCCGLLEQCSPLLWRMVNLCIAVCVCEYVHSHIVFTAHNLNQTNRLEILNHPPAWLSQVCRACLLTFELSIS